MLRKIARICSASRRGLSTTTDGPVFLVFGATSGIGSELCRVLVSSHPGTSLVLAGRDEEKLSVLQRELGAAAAVHAVDVLDPAAVEACTADAASRHRRLDGVASCVGSVILKSAHATTPAEFEHTLRVNLFSSFNVLRAGVKQLMKNPGGTGGSIVFCSSAVAKHGIANHEAIAAAKGGVAAMALSAAATYAGKNIRINCVAPGLTRTPMTARITGSESALKASVAMHALRRIGEPADVASAMAFLLDPRNAFVTGQVLAVDGGLSCLRPA